jgi:DNA polymerase-1
MTNINNKKILLLVDGNAIVHRSYHGIPPLKTRDGQMVNAVYGFASTLLASIKEFEPQYVVVAWDVGKKTFRNDKYKDYKAKRLKTPDELCAQFPLVKEFCEAFNIPQFGVKNYEADDVIGTICAKISNHEKKLSRLKGSKQSLKTIIITGDMDALQLVSNNVNVYSVSRGVKKAEIFDSEKVEKKYGFPACYLSDYKGLRGDASDNIPGVLGIGDKTATILIKKFQTIEKLYQFVQNDQSGSSVELSKINVNLRIVNLLKKYKDQAFLSKELATIKKDVDLDFSLTDAKLMNYDIDKVRKIFERFEFGSLYKKIPQFKTKESILQNSLF